MTKKQFLPKTRYIREYRDIEALKRAWKPEDYDKTLKDYEPSEYVDQAKEFLKATDTHLQINFKDCEPRFSDTPTDNYTVKVTRGNRSFELTFSTSIMNSRYLKFAGSKDRYSLDGNPLSFGKTKGYSLRTFQKETSFICVGTRPSPYDILTCLTDYDPGTLEDFCGDFGYDTDSIKANETYKAVLNEWKNVCTIWGDEEIEQLNEIC